MHFPKKCRLFPKTRLQESSYIPYLTALQRNSQTLWTLWQKTKKESKSREEKSSSANNVILRNIIQDYIQPIATTHPKFQVFKGIDNQFYFRLKAQNGEIILASEAYTAKQSAFDTIDRSELLQVLTEILDEDEVRKTVPTIGVGASSSYEHS